MEVFVACVEARSFSIASQVLGVTPQSIAKSISTLEKSLGARLINRSTRAQSLTEIGTLYYDKCKAVLKTVKESDSLVQNYTQQPKGVLKILVPTSFGVYALAHILPQWLGDNPDVSLDLTVADKDFDIIGGGYELAIVQNESIGDSRLICKHLLDFRVLTVASDTYLKRSLPLNHPQDLSNHVCIRLPEQNVWTFLDSSGKKIDVHLEARYLSTSCQISCQMAVDGLGITKQPYYVLSPLLQAGVLKQVLADYKIPNKGIYMLYPSREHLPVKLKRFIQFLEKNYGGKII